MLLYRSQSRHLFAVGIIQRVARRLTRLIKPDLVVLSLRPVVDRTLLAFFPEYQDSPFSNIEWQSIEPMLFFGPAGRMSAQKYHVANETAGPQTASVQG